ncbi:hypothetical protein I601_2141 [Nocardioides dokdonensis FR1436]|uniref:Uncharacterized protein n=1 Tax=Nocardioides dokdonensis FR1436 TaxID=1300347 RepID=A0A1A9GKF6_9ACTN|nr:hypothetical protein [Nocardioides dokdonensis]ANH38566.1 hypothetical protein I601_2141 [Nocardioides dokdonensis FR1436]
METEEQCDAAVKVRGDEKARWKTDGFTILQDGTQAFYKSTHKKFALSVFPDMEDMPAHAVLTVKGASYTTQDSGQVDADPEGSGAEVEAVATGVEPGASVKLTASISCTQ